MCVWTKKRGSMNARNDGFDVGLRCWVERCLLRVYNETRDTSVPPESFSPARFRGKQLKLEKAEGRQGGESRRDLATNPLRRRWSRHVVRA